MRPVLRTVNQDDPSMYHLFYADGAGTPGTEFTVFDLPRAARHRPGNNSIWRTGLRVTGAEALEYWAARLMEGQAEVGEIVPRDGRLALDFADLEGTRFLLVDDGGAGTGVPWPNSPVPPQYQLRGLGYPVLAVPRLDGTDRFLREGLGLTRVRTYTVADEGNESVETIVYSSPDGGPGAEVHVEIRPDLARAQYGGGGVHHIALMIPHGQDPESWARRLDDSGFPNTGVVDRFYFRSVYVREPNQVLFELATEGPGLGVGGSIDGERLQLPPFLESRRAEIERALEPLD